MFDILVIFQQCLIHRFLPRETVRISLSNISIESPWPVYYKDVIFSLAQIRAYILRDAKPQTIHA